MCPRKRVEIGRRYAPNPGPGGWAAVILGLDGAERWRCRNPGSAARTTACRTAPGISETVHLAGDVGLAERGPESVRQQPAYPDAEHGREQGLPYPNRSAVQFHRGSQKRLNQVPVLEGGRMVGMISRRELLDRLHLAVELAPDAPEEPKAASS